MNIITIILLSFAAGYEVAKRTFKKTNQKVK